MQKYNEYKQFLQQKKLWEPITYLFFGGLTTVVNIVVYLIFREGLLPDSECDFMDCFCFVRLLYK